MYPQSPEESARCLGAGVTGSHPLWGLRTNSTPLQEQQVPLTTEPPTQPPLIFTFNLGNVPQGGGAVTPKCHPGRGEAYGLLLQFDFLPSEPFGLASPVPSGPHRLAPSTAAFSLLLTLVVQLGGVGRNSEEEVETEHQSHNEVWFSSPSV